MRGHADQNADAVLVTSSFLPGRGGIESYLAELCATLAPRVAVLAPGSREGRPLPGDLGYPTVAGPGRMLRPSAGVAGAIEDACVAFRTDRVVYGTPWPLVLTGARIADRGLRYAVIVHGAELTLPTAVPALRSKLSDCLSRADLILPVSDYTAGRVRALLEGAGTHAPPIEVLRARVDLGRFHPGVDVAPARRHLRLDRERPIVLSLGRLVPRKGIGRLIEAMPEISARVPDALLVVAGTGPQEKKLRELAEETGAEVAFAGRVPDDIAPAFYALADVFALAVVDRYFGLEMEGLGVVLLEAQACATPCVTGRSGGTPEAVVDGATGFVVDAADRTILADRISGLLENPHLRAQLGRAGRRHVTENFSSEKTLAPLVRWLS